MKTRYRYKYATLSPSYFKLRWKRDSNGEVYKITNYNNIQWEGKIIDSYNLYRANCIRYLLQTFTRIICEHLQKGTLSWLSITKSLQTSDRQANYKHHFVKILEFSNRKSQSGPYQLFSRISYPEAIQILLYGLTPLLFQVPPIPVILLWNLLLMSYVLQNDIPLVQLILMDIHRVRFEFEILQCVLYEFFFFILFCHKTKIVSFWWNLRYGYLNRYLHF